MKSLKKALAVLLSVAMLASVAVPASAAGDDGGSEITQAFGKADVTVSSVEYDGKGHAPVVTVKVGDKVLVEGKDFTVKCGKKWAAGTYDVVIEGIEDYQGSAVTAKFTIKPKKNADGTVKLFKSKKAPSLKLTIGKTGTNTKTFKAKWLRKGDRAYKIHVSRDSRTKLDKNATVSYKVVKKSLRKYVEINQKNGMVTFKKNAPKGKYKIAVTSAGTDNFKAATKYVTFTIK